MESSSSRGKKHSLMNKFCAMDYLARPGGLRRTRDDQLTHYPAAANGVVDLTETAGIVRRYSV